MIILHDLNEIKGFNEYLNTKLYDLTESTFKSRNDIKYNYYYVNKHEEMRIDLICYNIYKSLNYIDILLNVNEIDNPLNIKEGDIIKYPGIDDIELFVIRSDGNKFIKMLSIKDRAHRPDEKRQKYIEQNYSLPPTVLSNPLEPVTLQGGNIVIGKGLFNT